MSISKSHDDEPDKQELTPELQLEPAHGGPGGTGKTAIGAGTGGDEHKPKPKPSSIPRSPRWFTMIFPLAQLCMKAYLSRLAPSRARAFCNKAKLTDDQLTVLHLRWHVNLNLEWAHKINGDTIKHIANTESQVEEEAVWRLCLCLCRH